MDSSLKKSYDEIYSSDALGNVKLEIKHWPINRYEGLIYFAERGYRVLDVGCGNGIVLFNLKDRYKELYGIELSNVRFNTCKKSLEGLNAILVNGDVEQGLPFEDDFFDTIVSSDVIEHLVNPIVAMREIFRVLKPGGLFICNTPNVARIKLRLKFLLGKFPSTSRGNEGIDLHSPNDLIDGGHLHYFTYSMLESLASMIGFVSPTRVGVGRLGKLHNFFPSLLSSTAQILMKKPVL